MWGGTTPFTDAHPEILLRPPPKPRDIVVLVPLFVQRFLFELVDRFVKSDDNHQFNHDDHHPGTDHNPETQQQQQCCWA